MKKLAVGILLALFTCASAWAADPSGNWCRSEGGNLVDVITVTSSGGVYKVNLREGWNKPVYAEGGGSFAGSSLVATVRRIIPDTVNNIHINMGISGNSMSYTSWSIDGAFRWKGEYSRCGR